MTRPYDSNIAHLRDELARVAALLRVHLMRFRLATPETQRERFWHLDDATLESLALDDAHSPLGLFETPPALAPMLAAAAARRADIALRVTASRAGSLRLPRLVAEFRLDDDETDALLLALLASLHSTYRHWYGIVQRDGARGHPAAGLVAEILAGTGADAGRHLARLAPCGKLAGARLIALGGTEHDALATRAVQVDDRVVLHLLGDDGFDARCATALRWAAPPGDPAMLPVTNENAVRLQMLPHLRAAEPSYLNRLRLRFAGPDTQLAVDAAALVAAGLRQRLLVCDVGAAGSGLAWPLAAELALREARLAGALPLFTHFGTLLESPDLRPRAEQLLRCLAGYPHPAALDVGTAATAGLDLGGDWIPFQFEPPAPDMREQLWLRRLAAGQHAVGDVAATARTLARAFQMTASQIDTAWASAQGRARHRNVFINAVTADDLFAGCREQSAQQLVAFAHRIEPRRGLTLERDIVLPPANSNLLRELRARIRHHGRLHGDMGLGEHMRLGRGVIALFAGGSGTGKTMAAEVLASEQRIDLYRIDLASLVSKWVGETEKNLGRVFADAERANCMLFFDECDAMFGRRGAVKDANDRWANLEVSYLLQRIEDYAGVVILATNLRQNIDDAFQRRIHVVVDFPVPDARARRAIWERLMPGEARRTVAPDELDELAQRFELSGGHIRNVVVDACYRALDDADPRVSARHLAASTAREFQKLARPVTRGEFGRFYEWVMQDVIDPVALHDAGGS
jgi:hypothetical protein